MFQSDIDSATIGEWFTRADYIFYNYYSQEVWEEEFIAWSEKKYS